jgi:hypothetical protein
MPLRNRVFQVRIRDPAAGVALCEKERVWSKGQKISHTKSSFYEFRDAAREVSRT